ncbi:MAG: phosphonopyruvate decarboxylase [Pseudomonadota bacterium]|nr:phosphonopyruvate decarboxylase [Pseudomonadota bacterium]
MIGAEAFVERARRLGFDWYAGVPCSFLTPFINYVIQDPALTYVSAANEGDALAAGCGAVLGGRRAVAMMQNSGLGNAVSPLTSLAWVFRIPVLLIVTWRGAPDLRDEPQHELMGQITAALLDTVQVPWELFPDQPQAIDAALDRAVGFMDREQRPYALIMRKGTVAPYALESKTVLGRQGVCRRDDLWQGRRPTRTAALERVVQLAPEADTVLIATTGYTGRELFALHDRPNHLYVVGSMGCASALGLGLAMTRPDWRVVVIDGDGAALMRLGNLATLGAYGGDNLFHLVLDNEVHDSTGGQATVSAGVDFAAIAAACGYKTALAGDSLEIIDALLAAPPPGPRFAQLKIRPGAPAGLPRPNVTPVQVKERLLAHLDRRR